MGEAMTPDVMRIRILGEFESPETVKDAAAALKEKGYSVLEGFVPWELEGLEDVLELPRPRIPLYVLLAGILGAVVGYGIQWWTNAVDYPINVGGRPLNPVPSFILITFETVILFAAFAAFLGVILGSRLPMLWQPLFEVPGFERATDDRFFLGIDERDPFFQPARARQDLLDVGALSVERVPRVQEVVAREKERSRLRQRAGDRAVSGAGHPPADDSTPGPDRAPPAPGGEA